MLIKCPHCGTRPVEEFTFLGDATPVRPTSNDPATMDQWFDYVYLRDNPKGLVFERWRHMHGCGRFFNAARHSVSDKFIMTYKAGEPKPTITQAQIDAVKPPAKGTPANEPVWTVDANTGEKGEAK